jgi:hypothetical protein
MWRDESHPPQGSLIRPDELTANHRSPQGHSRQERPRRRPAARYRRPHQHARPPGQRAGHPTRACGNSVCRSRVGSSCTATVGACGRSGNAAACACQPCLVTLSTTPESRHAEQPNHPNPVTLGDHSSPDRATSARQMRAFFVGRRAADRSLRRRSWQRVRGRRTMAASARVVHVMGVLMRSRDRGGVTILDAPSGRRETPNFIDMIGGGIGSMDSSKWMSPHRAP